MKVDANAAIIIIHNILSSSFSYDQKDSFPEVEMQVKV